MAEDSLNSVEVPFAGLVLAGGKSSRMGQDKATLMYKGSTWLDAAIKHFEQLGAAEILVNSPITTPYKNVLEPYPDQGPLSGIYGALLSTHLDLVIIPVDMPTLELNSTRSLLEHRLNFECVYFEDNPMPCWLKNSDKIRERIKQASIDSNNSKGLFANWKTLNAKIIEPKQMMQNFNTPGDIADHNVE
jgi:molybdopterin-guanine dinucleotide biosynthesis protein A